MSRVWKLRRSPGRGGCLTYHAPRLCRWHQCAWGQGPGMSVGRRAGAVPGSSGCSRPSDRLESRGNPEQGPELLPPPPGTSQRCRAWWWRGLWNHGRPSVTLPERQPTFGVPVASLSGLWVECSPWDTPTVRQEGDGERPVLGGRMLFRSPKRTLALFKNIYFY